MFKVQGWFTELISDSDVIQGSGINIDVLAKIVAQSGATVDSFGSFFAKRERHEKTIIDIGVLRFPDIEHPYFKVCASFFSSRPYLSRIMEC